MTRRPAGTADAPRNQALRFGHAAEISKGSPHPGRPPGRPAQTAGLTQVEPAKLVGETQQNITFWEHSHKPPRSDVLPKLAKVLGASVEQLLGISPIAERRSGPVGKTQRVFEEVARLPRSQQDKILEIVAALVDRYRRKAS